MVECELTISDPTVGNKAHGNPVGWTYTFTQKNNKGQLIPCNCYPVGGGITDWANSKIEMMYSRGSTTPWGQKTFKYEYDPSSYINFQPQTGVIEMFNELKGNNSINGSTAPLYFFGEVFECHVVYDHTTGYIKEIELKAKP